MKMFGILAIALVCATGAQAQVTRIAADDFNSATGQITFSEQQLGTVNPTYLPSQYGGDSSAPTVRFGGFFTGQSLSANPSQDCPGGAATACVVGTPTASLSLDALSPQTLITSDGANPTSPVLSGSPTFNGPISILFDVDQVAVGFDGGFFNAVGSTGIFAYDRQGAFFGSLSNTVTGIEFLGIGSSDGVARIAGVGLRLTGAEPAGFAIDNLRFARAGQVVVPSVPEPGTWAMLVLGFGLAGTAVRSRRRGSAVTYA